MCSCFTHQPQATPEVELSAAVSLGARVRTQTNTHSHTRTHHEPATRDGLVQGKVGDVRACHCWPYQVRADMNRLCRTRRLRSSLELLPGPCRRIPDIGSDANTVSSELIALGPMLTLDELLHASMITPSRMRSSSYTCAQDRKISSSLGSISTKDRTRSRASEKSLPPWFEHYKIK